MSTLFEYKGQAVPVKRDYNGTRYDESLRSDFTVRAENYEQVVQKVTEQLRELDLFWSWRVDVLTLTELETTARATGHIQVATAPNQEGVAVREYAIAEYVTDARGAGRWVELSNMPVADRTELGRYLSAYLDAYPSRKYALVSREVSEWQVVD